MPLVHPERERGGDQPRRPQPYPSRRSCVSPHCSLLPGVCNSCRSRAKTEQAKTLRTPTWLVERHLDLAKAVHDESQPHSETSSMSRAWSARDASRVYRAGSVRGKPYHIVAIGMHVPSYRQCISFASFSSIALSARRQYTFLFGAV